LRHVVKKIAGFFLSRLGTGLLIVAPLYLCLLLLLKAMNSLRGIMEPIAKLIPDWLPAEYLLSLLLILALCFLLGLLVRTPRGRQFWEMCDRSLFQRIPGYAVIRGLTQQLAGQTQDESWKPALVELEDALVPAFIIERLSDGFTVFVPSSPTPLAGTIYILSPERVHPVDVPFTHALQVVSRWGAGSRDLVAAMRKTPPP
jgi:uncharacterized membrane protein